MPRSSPFRSILPSMPTRRRPELARASVLAAVATLAVFLLAGNVSGARGTLTGAASLAWHSIFGDRPEQELGSRMIVVLSSPSLADRIQAAPGKPGPAKQRVWAADIETEQEAFLASVHERGIDFRREHVFTRTLNGFSATLDARAVAELDRNPAVLGLYPVRAVYPAEAESLRAPLSGTPVGLSLPGCDGTGSTVVLLDTGVDTTHPDLTARVARGFDLVDRDRKPDPAADPADETLVETHGTRMAGLVAAGSPGARILPIRVLGWRAGADGTYAVAGTGDTLIAGLERAVDPNRDGSVKDAATVALAPLVEPYAAFTDSPEARAVAGATRLGTLVVAAAGNDGSSGVGFGSVGAPGGAPEALTVGALDNRRQVSRAEAWIRAGSDTISAQPVRLLGKSAVSRETTLDISALLGPTLADPGQAPERWAGGEELGDYFATRGVSRVAGRAVLVPADGGPLEAKARNAKAAGAAALLVYGTALPGGALDIDEQDGIPVLALPGKVGKASMDALQEGRQVSVVLAPGGAVTNESFDHVAPFSSGGLAFDGRVKP